MNLTLPSLYLCLNKEWSYSCGSRLQGDSFSPKTALLSGSVALKGRSHPLQCFLKKTCLWLHLKLLFYNAPVHCSLLLFCLLFTKLLKPLMSLPLWDNKLLSSWLLLLSLFYPPLWNVNHVNEPLSLQPSWAQTFTTAYLQLTNLLSVVFCNVNCLQVIQWILLFPFFGDGDLL